MNTDFHWNSLHGLVPTPANHKCWFLVVFLHLVPIQSKSRWWVLGSILYCHFHFFFFFWCVELFWYTLFNWFSIDLLLILRAIPSAKPPPRNKYYRRGKQETTPQLSISLSVMISAWHVCTLCFMLAVSSLF